MSTMTKKTTILFPPKVYRQLEHVAHQQSTSVADLVRRAVIQRYLLPDPRTRLEAVKAIAAMQLPLGDWPTMEREIMLGRLGKQR